MEDQQKTLLFEEMPIPRAVAKLAVPTILSSLVTVLYNLADTYFVGMLNNSVQNAAVTLAAPLILAFNAVNNLFGVGSSSMMSRALGSRDYETVHRSSAFGFYCSIFCGLLFSLLYVIFQPFVLTILGADATTAEATAGYLRWTVACGAAPNPERGDGLSGEGGRRSASCQHRNHERMYSEYHSGSGFHSALGP